MLDQPKISSIRDDTIPLEAGHPLKFYIRTLGCKMNLLDSARVASALLRAGYDQVDDEVDADLVLVNSCTVTAESDRKSRRAAQGASRDGKRVVVLGCGPRVDPNAWRRALPLVDVFPSEVELGQSLGIEVDGDGLRSFPRTRLPIPIQQGCDNTCAYCITRIARGPHRSEPLDQVLRWVDEAVSLGAQEVVFTGINLAAWGCHTTTKPEQSRLPELLRAVLGRTKVRRIRLSSLGPEYLGEEFFDVFADERICDHLHLSVQSGSPPVLARMGRGHGVEEVLEASSRARRVRPNVALTADFIVGLPGETEEDCGLTLSLARRVSFAQLHVFPFSAREGTAAASMPDQVSSQDKKRRSKQLRALGEQTRKQFLTSQVGRSVEVLFQGDGTALTSNYIRLRSERGDKGEMALMEIRLENVMDR